MLSLTRCCSTLGLALLTAVTALGPTTAAAEPPAHPSSPSTPAHPLHARGGVIVWTHRAAEGSEQLMIADADGSNARELTTARPDTSDIDAQVSPDGRWILFERVHTDPSTLYLVRPDGTGEHALDVGCGVGCIEAGTPTWLSTTRIAYTLVRGPVDESTGYAAAAALYTARSDGTHVRRWSRPGIDGTTEETGLRVSADRRFVTLKVGPLSDGRTALFRAARDGSHRRQLTPWALKADIYDLSTARHGRTKDLVVFESYARGTGEDTFVDLATVPATCRSLRACTRRLRWLTDNAASGTRNANPQWSPDGRKLVFTGRPSFSDPNADIFRARYPLVHRRQVSTSPAFDFRPAWGVSPGPANPVRS